MKPAALVTGSAVRLGRDIALHLGKAGYFVFIHYRFSEKQAHDVAQEILNLGGAAQVVQADLSHKSSIENLLTQIKIHTHQLALLVHNVGEYATGSLVDFPEDKFDSIIQTNLLGSYYLIQRCFPLMTSQGGQIINIGYTGLNSNQASPHKTAYVISKSGLYQLTKSYAICLAPYNIRVNMISPGHLENSIDLPKEIGRQIPAGRPGTSQDVLHVLNTLIDPGGNYITGQNIEVAGGYGLTAPDEPAQSS